MFYTPLYIFHFPRHGELKYDTMNFVKNDSLYSDYSTAPHIKLSGPNLHKEQIMKPYYYFMMDCLNYVMDDLGYAQEQSITSMWATRQERGMFHHPHKHGNTFLAGVYYLHGSDKTFGTSFFNPDNLLQISPTLNLNKKERLTARYSNPFVEGDFIVFPAWTLHNTPTHVDEEPRYILGVNSMPVGKTVDEVYDRFNYPDAASTNLDFNQEEFNRYQKEAFK